MAEVTEGLWVAEGAVMIEMKGGRVFASGFTFVLY